MSNPTVYLTVSAMYALRYVSSQGALPSTRDEFAEIIEKRYQYQINEDSIERVILQLREWNLITILEDKYAGEMFQLFGAKSDEAFEKVSELGHDEVVSHGRTGGIDWFKKVFSHRDFWNDLYNDQKPEPSEPDQIETNAEDLEVVPASDRIVSREDNKSGIDIIESDIRGLSTEIQSSNEIAIELGDEKEVIAGELEAAEVLISQPKFRLNRLANLLLPALKFLAEKFSASAVGELAKRLISALAGLF